MVKYEVVDRKNHLLRGLGWTYYKALDDCGETIKIVSLIINFKQIVMFAHGSDGWYSKVKSNKLRFTKKGRAIYLYKLAIRLPNKEEI